MKFMAHVIVFISIAFILQILTIPNLEMVEDILNLSESSSGIMYGMNGISIGVISALIGIHLLKESDKDEWIYRRFLS